MSNTLLVVLREMNRYSPAGVAKKLDIDTATYNQIESGEILMNHLQAKAIGQLYKMKPLYIYEAARQLDALLTQEVLIKTLKSRLDDVNDSGNLKELCNATIKMCNETDVFIKRMNATMQQIGETYEKTNEQTNAIIKQTNEIYHLVNVTIEQTKKSFTETYDNCQQTTKEISEMNDSLTQENDELKKRLGISDS